MLTHAHSYTLQSSCQHTSSRLPAFAASRPTPSITHPTRHPIPLPRPIHQDRLTHDLSDLLATGIFPRYLVIRPSLRLVLLRQSRCAQRSVTRLPRLGVGGYARGTHCRRPRTPPAGDRRRPDNGGGRGSGQSACFWLGFWRGYQHRVARRDGGRRGGRVGARLGGERGAIFSIRGEYFGEMVDRALTLSTRQH